MSARGFCWRANDADYRPVFRGLLVDRTRSCRAGGRDVLLTQFRTLIAILANFQKKRRNQRCERYIVNGSRGHSNEIKLNTTPRTAEARRLTIGVPSENAVRGVFFLEGTPMQDNLTVTQKWMREHTRLVHSLLEVRPQLGRCERAQETDRDGWPKCGGGYRRVLVAGSGS